MTELQLQLTPGQERLDVDLRRTAAGPLERGRAMAWALRISCFVSITLGILSLLRMWTGLGGAAVGPALVSADEALGLIFMGFAVRLSRLEANRRTVRIVGYTSRICLILLGMAALAGWRILERNSSWEGGTSVAAGASYLLIGIELILRNSSAGKRVHTALTALACIYIGACWVSGLFAALGVAHVPDIFRMHGAVLAVLTGVCAVLTMAARTPGMLRVLMQNGPEAEAARVLFPLAFAIPVVLAVLRQMAESRGLVQSDLGLLLHVLLSAGSMGLMIVWNANRINVGIRLQETAATAARELETQYRDLFEVLQDPVWIFGAQGQLYFRNDAAREFGTPEGRVSDGGTEAETVLGASQQRSVLSAALLGRQVPQVTLRTLKTGEIAVLPVRFLRTMRTTMGEPGNIVLVARASLPQTLEMVSIRNEAAPGNALLAVAAALEDQEIELVSEGCETSSASR
jgi:PAS domain-containing protein